MGSNKANVQNIQNISSLKAPDRAQGTVYGDTSWIEDDCPDTFSEFIFPFPPCSCSV